ncbi:hypothetical protein ACWEKM_39425 [Streptomyces sp. NPDC004752]
MTKGDFGAFIVATWTLSILSVVMTATSQSRANPTRLERMWWKWAMEKAQDRRVELVRKTRASDQATCPDSETLDYLQRDDILLQVSQKVFRAKMRVPAASSVPAGAVLALAVASGKSHEWQEALMIGVFLAPAVITIAVIQLAGNQGMQRWSTEVVTARARGAYEALLEPLAVSGVEPPKELPFQAPQASAVQALDGLALALEQYALQRALPDGRNPMPQVVAHFSSAAALVRELRDSVELDRPDGGKRALLEMQRILKILADGRMRAFAPDQAASDALLQRRQQRQSLRRQMLRGLAFTLCLAGIVFALASSAVGVAMATAAAAGAVASWDKILRLSTGPDGSRPTNS